MFRMAITLIYWLIVVDYLRDASPVFHDGSGPMPSFYWSGRMPSPDPAEYREWSFLYDTLFQIPYLAVGGIITFIGLQISPALVSKRPALQGHCATTTGLVTFGLLVALCLVSDAGSCLGFWSSPKFLLHRVWDLFGIFNLSQVFVPASVLSSAVCRLAPPRGSVQ